jgi:hypothetical protein
MLIYCRWVPVYADQEQNLAVMSIGFLLKNKNVAVVWRGPKKHGAVTSSFSNYVIWKLSTPTYPFLNSI